MDPLRYNFSQLYGRPLYTWILLVFSKLFPISPFSATLSFPNRDPSLSKQSSRREEVVCAGPLNRSIGLEKEHWKGKEVL
jgi:hypothetical protein